MKEDNEGRQRRKAVKEDNEKAVQEGNEKAVKEGNKERKRGKAVGEGSEGR